MLLVYRVDRFSRNLRDTVTLLDELDQLGVVSRSATEPFDTSTPMGRMLVQMLGMFAQFERDSIIERVIAGMERKAAKGLWKGGRRPFGYTVDRGTRYNSSTCNTPRLNADAVDAAVLDALGCFYRNQHTLITDAINTAQAEHDAGHADRYAELAAVDTELNKVNAAIDRYLSAFERGTLDEDMVADRLPALREQTKQLRARRTELAAAGPSGRRGSPTLVVS